MFTKSPFSSLGKWKKMFTKNARTFRLIGRYRRRFGATDRGPHFARACDSAIASACRWLLTIGPRFEPLCSVPALYSRITVDTLRCAHAFALPIERTCGGVRARAFYILFTVRASSNLLRYVPRRLWRSHRRRPLRRLGASFAACQRCTDTARWRRAAVRCTAG